MSNFKDNASFSDIRVGDTIKATLAARSGLTYTTTGVVNAIVGDRVLGGETGDEVIVYRHEVDGGTYSVTITSRPEHVWEVGQFALDREGDVWIFGIPGWSCVTRRTLYARCSTDELIYAYGPLRPAKVVEAEQ